MAKQTNKIQNTEFEQKLRESMQQQENNAATQPAATSPVLGNHITKTTAADEKTIPVIEEQVTIDKKTVTSGTVNIKKNVREEDVVVDIPTMQEEVDVQRVKINKYVEATPAVRYEGDKMIIPVVHEVLVVEKRLMLVEEIHVTKHRVQTNEKHHVAVLKEEIRISRTNEDTP